jgi:hypothetical protein
MGALVFLIIRNSRKRRVDLYSYEYISQISQQKLDSKPPSLKYCVNCGNPTPIDAKFCGRCGNSVEYSDNNL